MKARKAAQAKRNRQVAIAAIGAVVVAVIAIVAFGGGGGGPSPSPSTQGTDAAKVAAIVTKLPAATLDTVGVGQNVTPPMALPASTPALTEKGKPNVFYYGAEYCPYCAAQRWPLTIALGRFGTFAGLGLTTSSSTDTAPNTPTLSFHGSTYTSSYISFSAVETQTRTGQPLDTTTSAQQGLVSTFDASPYTSQTNAIPFLMIGNKYIQIGASMDPNSLAGMTQMQVASALSDPVAPTTLEIGGAANALTAAICQLTNGQPTNVCTAPGVTAAAATLPTTPPAGA